ncbi:MAG: O-antigen ligase family protein [Candidatus Andersenbacteria bacterium]
MAIVSTAAAYLPLVLATSALAVGASWWALVFPRIAIWFLAVSVIVGQLVRVPVLGQGGGVLLSDIAAVVVIGAGLLKWKQRTAPLPSAVVLSISLVAPFIIWSLGSLLINVDSLPPSGSSVALLYWLRTSTYILLIPVLGFLASDTRYRRELHRGLVVVVAVLIGLGFLQLVLASDLSFLSQYGWDPHQRRLVSSWLDPNFMGAFFLIVLPWLAVQAKNNWKYAALAAVTLIALLATQSRSSLVALAAVAGVAFPFIVWALPQKFPAVWQRISVIAVVINLVIMMFVGGVFLLGGRAGGFVRHDPTVVLRTESFSLAWQRVVQPNTLLGVGYNAYQFAAAETGLIGDFSLHSRAGADNSWVTLWATTGVLGMLLFALPWAVAAMYLGLRAVRRADWIAGAGPLAILGLFVHSQFVNSFLYAHLLIALAVVVVLSFPSYVTADYS